MEAIGVMLLPQMLAARDLPFPRLSAYAFWAYLVGGLCFFASIFFGLAPNGGWFMYPQLTSTTFSPGINADFWLLGIGFIEIGRASCRERGCQYVLRPVVAASLKHKIKNRSQMTKHKQCIL